ncbi:hypothetical protein [Tsuneonella troitsensis]|uniref:hypothetical protein n=1 Tax=Tsuneonella troitsensis TaxID=292222 RepID=UPI001F292D55|nr:hypothetical protein [Tsuneonella troitsensis]
MIAEFVKIRVDLGMMTHHKHGAGEFSPHSSIRVDEMNDVALTHVADLVGAKVFDNSV